MNPLIEFIRDLVNDDAMIKRIASGKEGLSEQTLSDAYRKYSLFDETLIGDKVVVGIQEKHPDYRPDNHGFSLLDVVTMHLDRYEQCKNRPLIYFAYYQEVRNLFNLNIFGSTGRRIGRLQGFKFQKEDLSLRRIFRKHYKLVGPKSPTDPNFEAYYGLLIIKYMFEECDTPFEALALVKFILKDNQWLDVSYNDKGEVKFTPTIEKDKSKLNFKYVMARGVQVSLKELLLKNRKHPPYDHQLWQPYKKDLFLLLQEVPL